MAIAFVRATPHITGNGVNSAAGSFASLPAAGNSIIVPVACWDNDVAVGEVTDNQGNSYTQDKWAGPTGGTDHAAGGIHSDIDIGTPSGTFTITINPSNATDYIEGVGVEFSGLADSSAVDISTSALGNNQSPTASGGTSNQADELWVGIACAQDNDDTLDIGWDFPAGWTQIGDIISNPGITIAFISGYKIVSTTGTITFNGGTIRTGANGW